MNILGISGSLRKGSFNTKLLLHLKERAAPRATVELAHIGNLPLFDEDLDTPAVVERFRADIERADALLIATPEYNYSVPGGLKNAIDWASRPAFQSVLAHKPAAMLAASRGPTGGARALGHLRQILGGTLTPLYPAPELVVPAAHAALGDGGPDEKLAERLERFWTGFLDWVERGR